jgi:hypothetical protein
VAAEKPAGNLPELGSKLRLGEGSVAHGAARPTRICRWCLYKRRVVLADLLAELIQLGGEILLDLIIFAVVFLPCQSGSRGDSFQRNAELLSMAVRVAIVVMAGAMALRQMGWPMRSSISLSAWCSALIAVAAVIAFGWGGREVAARQLERWEREAEVRGWRSHRSNAASSVDHGYLRWGSGLSLSPQATPCSS